MKPLNPRILCGFLLYLIPFVGMAQPAIEFAAGSGPAGTGSSLSNQVITFLSNPGNPIVGPFSPLVPTVTATYAISNQQYVLPPTQNPNGGDICFGTSLNASGIMVNTAPLFPAMNWISAPSNADFSSTQVNIGTGIAAGTNQAVEFFSSCMGLYNANLPTNGRYYMADLTITFNIPITNPVIHIVGIGGTFNALGFSTELQLVTPGVTLSELSGSKELNVTPTAILNSAATPTATTGSGAASGSILATGSTISSLHFQIYMRGDGKTPTWSNGLEHTGDAWLVGISALNTLIELPVGISSFTAKPEQHSADLQWTTATEQNSSYFAIQRSSNGTDWTSIGQVSAAGNSENPLQYNYVDGQPLTGANYYRLQEVGNNGASVYSPIQEVEFESPAMAINWYPNPTHDRLTITGSAMIKSITLTTLDGRILQAVDGFTAGQSLDLGRYPFGLYFLIIRTADNQTHIARIERN
jgi:hypothetical protein